MTGSPCSVEVFDYFDVQRYSSGAFLMETREMFAERLRGLVTQLAQFQKKTR